MAAFHVQEQAVLPMTGRFGVLKVQGQQGQAAFPPWQVTNPTAPLSPLQDGLFKPQLLFKGAPEVHSSEESSVLFWAGGLFSCL